MRASALLLLPLGLCVLGAARPIDEKADFDAAFARVQKSMAAGKWKEAKALLGSSLEAHASKPYVLARRDEVRAAWSTCAFELAVPNRGVPGLFLGEVASYDAKSGEIEVRWTRPKTETADKAAFPGDDFEKLDVGHVLRAPFDGPHSIEVSGKSLTLVIGKPWPSLIGCLDDGARYETTFIRGANSLDEVEGEDRRNLATCTDDLPVDRPYALKLTVKAKDIEGSCNGKRLVSADKPRTLGRPGFRDVPAPDKIVVKGKLSRSWAEEGLAARRTKERERFENDNDETAGLPDWLR